MFLFHTLFILASFLFFNRILDDALYESVQDIKKKEKEEMDKLTELLQQFQDEKDDFAAEQKAFESEFVADL